MRLVTYAVAGQVRLGAVVGDQVVDLNLALQWQLRAEQGYSCDLARRLAGAMLPIDLGEFLGVGTVSLNQAQILTDFAMSGSEAKREALRAEGAIVPLTGLHYVPPIGVSGNLYAVGRNYSEHVTETGAKIPDVPAIFLRVHSSFVGHMQPIVRPKVSHHFDWEAELAVVIGKPCRYVKPADALNYVAGYTIFNDGSIRDYQIRGQIPVPGKNFYHSGSLGPWLVTADEVKDPQCVSIVTRIDEEIMQSASTSEMIFDVKTIIAFLSEFTQLQPGDVVTTGSPSGVGYTRQPPRFLRPDDRLRITLGGIGTLENFVIDEALIKLFRI